MSRGRGPKRRPRRRPAASSRALARASTSSGPSEVCARAAVLRKSGCGTGETGRLRYREATRKVPREASSWRRARARVCSTGPRLPPRASATGAGRLRSILVVDVLFRLGSGDLVVVELGLDQLVLRDVRDRLVFL